MRGGLGELVPRTNREAVVAAVDSVADRLAKLVRYRAFVLDRQIGNAAGRIEPDTVPGKALVGQTLRHREHEPQ